MRVKVGSSECQSDRNSNKRRSSCLVAQSAAALQKLKYGMPADLADSLKADEEYRKTDHATLVAAKESEEVATLGDFETGVDVMKGDLTETESNEALSEWEEDRQKRRADELRSRSLLRRSSPQSVRRFLWPCDSTGGCAAGLRMHRRQHGVKCTQSTAMQCFFG